MTIGIGVTTYKRPKHLELCLSQITKTMTGSNRIYVADDSLERKGIAYRKNECLRALKDCDYIFLFDDDCFPISTYWSEFFINTHLSSGQHHFLYLKQTGTIKRVMSFNNIDVYNNCGGCFMFLTKEVIEKVGGYNKDYGIYGYEHAGYTQRIHKAGLTSLGAYICPQGVGEYIYAMDYDNHLQFNKQVKHKSSVEIFSAQKFIEQNKLVYLQDVNTIYQQL